MEKKVRKFSLKKMKKMLDEKDLTKHDILKNIKDRIFEIEQMVEFAASRGKSLPDAQMNTLKEVYSTLEIRNEYYTTEEDISRVLSQYNAVNIIYADLHKIIRPVSARSLSATRQTLGGLFYRIPAINLITATTIMFVVS